MRQRAQIALHQRLDRRQIEVADEDKGEVTKIGKAFLIDAQRSFEIHFADQLLRPGPGAEVVLREHELQRIGESSLRAGAAIGQDAAHPGLIGGESRRISAWGRAVEVDQLEHHFKIFGGSRTAQALLQPVDPRLHRDDLVGQALFQGDLGQMTDAAAAHHAIGGTRRDKLLICTQRKPAWARCGKEHFVVFEIRRLEQDHNAIFQSPARQPQLGQHLARDNRRPHVVTLQQRRVIDLLDIRLDLALGDGGEKGQ